MMRSKLRVGVVRDQEGSALIEAAIVLSVTVALLIGILQFAVALFSYCNVTYSSRAAARYASLHSAASLAPATSASIQAIVQPYLVGVSASNATITTTYSGANAVGQTVKIAVAVHYSLSFPIAGNRSISVASTAQRTIMR